MAVCYDKYKLGKGGGEGYAKNCTGYAKRTVC